MTFTLILRVSAQSNALTVTLWFSKIVANVFWISIFCVLTFNLFIYYKDIFLLEYLLQRNIKICYNQESPTPTLWLRRKSSTFHSLFFLNDFIEEYALEKWHKNRKHKQKNVLHCSKKTVRVLYSQFPLRFLCHLERNDFNGKSDVRVGVTDDASLFSLSDVPRGRGRGKLMSHWSHSLSDQNGSANEG